MSDLVGERIGNYCITSLIKRGGMGAVYLAEHPEIGRKVAIKVMFKTLDEESRDAERFLFEARAAANIVHPNVIDIYDFGRLEDGRPYLVMELLQGQELKEIILQHGKMTAAEVLPYLRQICAGLQAAHNEGIVHRDLKPENVFVLARKPLAVRVLDFGIAKTQTWSGATLTSTGKILGTPLVIAPEQASCESASISPRTDLYSLGVILYWMLSGEPPFPQDAPVVLVARHILTPPRPLEEVEPSVPPEVAALVNQCLEKSPEARPATASEVSARFAAALGEATEHEEPVVPWARVRSIVPRGTPTPTDLSTSANTSASTMVDAVHEARDDDHGEEPEKDRGEGRGKKTGTDLDVPGLDQAFSPPQEEPGPAPAEPVTASTTGGVTPAPRRWLAILVLGLVAAAALGYAVSASRRPAASPPDAGSAQAGPDSAAPDLPGGRPPDSGPASPPPDLRQGAVRQDSRARRGPRPPGPRTPPRRPPGKLPWCPESRVGESTMNPFGVKCRKK